MLNEIVVLISENVAMYTVFCMFLGAAIQWLYERWV